MVSGTEGFPEVTLLESEGKQAFVAEENTLQAEYLQRIQEAWKLQALRLAALEILQRRTFR